MDIRFLLYIYQYKKNLNKIFNPLKLKYFAEKNALKSNILCLIL